MVRVPRRHGTESRLTGMRPLSNRLSRPLRASSWVMVGGVSWQEREHRKLFAYVKKEQLPTTHCTRLVAHPLE